MIFKGLFHKVFKGRRSVLAVHGVAPLPLQLIWACGVMDFIMLSITPKCPQAVIASCYVPWMYLTVLYFRQPVPCNSDLMSSLEVKRVDLRGL